jgi:hypothetical protein
MSKLYGPKPIQQSGNLLDHVQTYAFNSDGSRTIRFHDREDRLPYKVRKARALTELQILILTQANLALREDLDEKQRREAHAILSQRYARLARYLEPKDLERLKATVKG